MNHRTAVNNPIFTKELNVSLGVFITDLEGKAGCKFMWFMLTRKTEQTILHKHKLVFDSQDDSKHD